MTSKSDKEKRTAGNMNAESGKNAARKDSLKPSKEQQVNDEDDDGEEDDVEETRVSKKTGKAAVSSKKSKSADEEDDDDDADEKPDDWEKPEEEEEDWDPDFREFDVPKSKGKKATGGIKAVEEEEDFKIDDEFKDLFNENSFDDEEEDDY